MIHPNIRGRKSGPKRMAPQTPIGHQRCLKHPDRVVPMYITRCWLCEEQGPDMARLDALIARGARNDRQDQITRGMQREGSA